MQAGLKGKITEATFKKYHYKNLILKGEVENQTGRLSANMEDPNLDFSLQTQADLRDSIPAVNLQFDVNNLDLQALHLQDQKFTLQGKISADIDQLDVDKPDGKILLDNWNIENDTQRIHIDSVSLTAKATEAGNTIALRSPLAKADIEGDYKLSEMGALMQRLKEKYLGADSLEAEGQDSSSAWEMNLDLAL